MPVDNSLLLEELRTLLNGDITTNQAKSIMTFAMLIENILLNNEVELAPVSTDATSITLSSTNLDQVIRCTAGTTVTVAVPTLPVRSRVVLIQEGAGQVQLSADGVTLQHPATFNPNTAEQNSLITLLWLSPTVVQVVGDLEVV